MRFNSNRTNQRNDFEDFARFLGMNGQRGQANGNFAQNTARSVANSTSCTQNRYSSGARCDVNSQGNVSNVQNGRSLAMVYAEKQAFESIFDPEIALINGTIFEQLYMPFQKGSCRGVNDNGEGCF
ncbi:MAG: spore coat associated protein CotJA [Clostridia bacterium]|nr:spore coat associated protein CotJA [Clostridia bacterium]